MLSKRNILCALLGAIILTALAPAFACAITRDTVIARGKVWVDKNVPYSQSRYASVEGTLVATKVKAPADKGFRTDCSGFVSMCLGLTRTGGLPKSLDTASLSSVLATIPKEALLPGDVILRPKGSNVAYGHAVLFVKWADAAHTKYWSYEESGGSKGTVTRLVPYPFFGEKGFKPYRYKAIADFYADVETAIYSSTRYRTAARAVHMPFPGNATAPAIVLADGEEWTGNVGASALASACGGPLLLTDTKSLTASTAAEIKRLKPARVYLIGGTSKISAKTSGQVAKLAKHVTRISAGGRFALAAKIAATSSALLKAKKRSVDTAYLIGSDDFSDGVAVAPISVRTARPVFLSQKATATRETLAGLKAVHIKRVVIIGSTSQVGAKVVAELKARHYTVSRIFGKDRYATALKVAQHGAGLRVGLTWSHVGVSSGETLHGMLSCAVSQGQVGALVLLTPNDKLHTATRAQIAAKAKTAVRVRVFGGYSQVEMPVRASIAKLLRAAK